MVRLMVILLAASVGLVDILAVVVIVFTGDHIFVQSCNITRKTIKGMNRGDADLPKRRLLDRRYSSLYVELKRPFAVLSTMIGCFFENRVAVTLA